jgi:hypothetical protein
MEEKINIMVQNMMKEDNQNKPGLGNSEDNKSKCGILVPGTGKHWRLKTLA